ncbi:iron complex transport system substrate-binding protein [Marinobacter salarius]|jgi:iron complex transport system substrate-binding protein|uniref:Iron ABC transporter substrate-binding protein n=1 Tax=Marinobacter salarius TaxID=1420917 RepID=W5YVV7_9GAMM|nr:MULTISPECIES: ABC transporter substrate-binding protein [Marinobacter]AHI30623.1 iron ABC transporter substrate-binding protein [Marinobacter salarius]KXJ46596.1 MAG: iron ABC transporter substrate-binding protein [Marinobacter sp. Hex_13]MBS8231157.1 iron ABC transporter substrate-binding protein [Marinobacter salarius]SFL73042.1 iron complex transport system substrate-binding protein [Marinobacter salarius]|tara:strand:+ start:4261 stop:5409 length:1149 start_codon:yes stop_codon:yes gene_type:complete
MIAIRTIAALLGGVLLFQASLAQAARTVTDLAGRTVEIPMKVERVVLGESRYIPALAILEGDRVVDRLAGLLPDFEKTDPAGYAQYLERFPALAGIPRVGHASADSFSLESVLSMGADLAIFSVEGHGPGARNSELIERLERAGVAVVFIDFRQNPLRNTPKSMAVLGEVLGRQNEANTFNDFYRTELDRVTDAVAEIPRDQWPTIFLHSRVGLHDSCCETMVHGMMGLFIEAAGGINIAADRIPGVSGVLNLEYLITDQPDRYLATAIGSVDLEMAVEEQPYVVLGAGVSEPVARRSLARVTDRPGLAALDAIREQRAFAIWHHFYNTPLNVVAVQALARWLHPKQLGHLQPERTLAEFYERFQPVELNGTYWVTLGEETP